MVASRTTGCLLGGLLAVLPLGIGTALAFPFVDPSNEDTLPTAAPLGTELPAPDVTGLQNQLRLTNPYPAGNPNTWTIIPRFTLQEAFTDNALELESPRKFDAITVAAPGISIMADTARLKLNLDYSPSLALHAIEGSLNTMTQQLSATGLVTVVPDLAFVDLRAVAGTQPLYGTLSGNGTLGNAGGNGLAPATTGIGNAGQAGINPHDESQTVSVGISPYLLRQFKDYGTGKLGVSVDASNSNTITGFAATPFPTGGNSINNQSLLTSEEIAQFTTGEFLGKLQDVLVADLQQSHNRYSGGTVLVTNGLLGEPPTLTSIPATTFSSQRETINNQLSYAINRNFTVLGSFGQQNIKYSNNQAPAINGLIWNIGLTITPSPDSMLTVTYGRQNGVDAFSANGYLAVGGRSQLSFSYSNTVGTQLENIQNQLNLSAFNNNTQQLVNALNNSPNFAANNALGIATGVYRFNTMNVAFSTGWTRDQVQANATWSVQTNLTPGATILTPINGSFNEFIRTPTNGTQQSVDVKTASVVWTHQLNPDLTMSSSSSYTFLTRSNGQGNDSTLAAAVGLQYALSAATSVTARYSFFDRISHLPGYTIYENLLLLGYTKQF